MTPEEYFNDENENTDESQSQDKYKEFYNRGYRDAIKDFYSIMSGLYITAKTFDLDMQLDMFYNMLISI